MANGQPFLVFEIEPDPAPGRPPGLPGKVPARYGMSEVGCFFADSGEAACRMAARSLNRLGYFVAVATIAPELDFQPTGKNQTLPSVVEQKEPAEKTPPEKTD
jgi:hypothetical protein